MIDMGQFFKASDLAILGNIVVMIGLYLNLIIRSSIAEKHSFARHLSLGIVTLSTGNLILIGNYCWVYWLHHADPMDSLATPIVRLLYIAFILMGTSMHIASYVARRLMITWWPTAMGWTCSVTVCTLLLAVYLD